MYMKNLRFIKSHSIKPATENQGKKDQDCKVVPINDLVDQDFEDSSEEATGFDFDFLKFYYFIPVALLIAVIYPIIYTLIVFKEVKKKTWVVLKSIF
jgi:hypothetical protein